MGKTRTRKNKYSQRGKKWSSLGYRMYELRSWKSMVERIHTKLTKKAKGELKGPVKSNKVFKFGDNGVLKSKGKYTIPITAPGKNWTMEVDVVKSDIPILMSKDMIKEMKMIINLEDDMVSVEGKRIKLRTTIFRGYILPLEKNGGKPKKRTGGW